MASLVDIFNPSFFMFLGILVLVAALLVVYFESKNREQNHKMASMLNLVTCMADEMNAIKVHLTQQTTNFGIGGSGSQPEYQHQPSSLETNNIHIVKTDLIAVSDDSDSDSDNDSENSIEDNESDSGSESNSEDIEEVPNIIEIGENPEIKVLKLSLSLSNINDIDENKDVNEFEELGDLEIIDDEDDNSSIGSVSVSSNEEDNVNENKNDNDNNEIDISKLNLKSINISSLEEVKNSDIDYKKFTLSKLRSTVVEKGLVIDSSKLKKNELLKLLGAE
jgi:hypothetical protein